MADEQQEQEQGQLGESHFTRNFIIGVGATLVGYFLYRRNKSQLDKKLTLESSMRLTKNFTLGEFLVSSEAPELKEYILSEGEFDNVKRLAVHIQWLRDSCGKAIIINSGGRPDTLKIKSGKYAGLSLVQMLEEKGYSPSSFSQHMDFSAADFTTTDKQDLLKIYKMIIDYENNPVFTSQITQAILYIQNGVPNFIHFGVHSSLNNFEKIIGDNKHLLAKVSIVIDNEGKRHRGTKYIRYSSEILDAMLKV